MAICKETPGPQKHNLPDVDVLVEGFAVGGFSKHQGSGRFRVLVPVLRFACHSLETLNCRRPRLSSGFIGFRVSRV